MNLIEKLNWRYAAKRMTGTKLPKEKIESILEAIRLSASSYGLQPFNVIVLEDKELRTKIAPAAYNQPQITEASHLLVFAAWDDITPGKIDEYINDIASTRGISADALNGMKDMLINTVAGRTKEENFNWSARQSYLALGTGLVAAAVEEVDATPMEGFNPAELDKILGLKEKGLRSVALLALGYRDTEKDPMSAQKKVRRASEKLFINIA